MVMRPNKPNKLDGRLAGALLVLLLTGCASVGPDYHAPPPDLKPLRAPAELPQPASNSTVALDTWWQGFHDPELTRIVERAQSQNLDLAASLARVEQARAVAKAAGAQRLPSVDLAIQTDTEHQSLVSPIGGLASVTPGYKRNETLYDEGIGASWEADLFGGLRRGEEAAKAEAQAAEADRMGVRVSVTADAADTYFQIRGDQQRLQLAQQQIDVDSHILALIQERNAQGASSDRELAQAQALVEQAQATLPPLRLSLQTNFNRLDVLMGAQPGTYAAELGTASMQSALPPIHGELQPEALLQRRPDIIAAERRLAVSNARIGVAIADYYPNVSLAGLLGFESLGSASLISAASFQPQIVMGLRWRLFDFGKVDAEVRQAKGAHAEALAHYRQTVLRAAEDVEDGFTSVAQYENQSREIDAEVVALKRANRTTEEAYEAGSIAMIDVLDTERQLLVAQDDGARAHTNALRAAVFSFRAMGGGW
jgi:NodT family efflux transporter outer membrane factor (OMF) lipoprotein